MFGCVLCMCVGKVVFSCVSVRVRVNACVSDSML